VDFDGTRIINVYAPSGTEKKTEREAFSNTDLIHLLPTTRTDLLLAGDFNCILHAAESTGHKQFSKGLAATLNGFRLHDVREASPTQPG
jgi:exonuclease III